MNMTARELADWLRTVAASQDAAAGDRPGPATGQQVLHVLSRRRTDVTPQDVEVMRGVHEAIRARLGATARTRAPPSPATPRGATS